MLIPSSAEAAAAGCLCPDQHNGTDALGIEWGDTWTTWAIRSDCPVHGAGLPVNAEVAAPSSAS